MKVTNQSSLNPQLIEKKGTERLPGSTDGSKSSQSTTGKLKGSADSLVEISDGARLRQRAVDVAKQVPEGSAQRVASLKKSIQDGTYKIDAKQIAERLVDEHLGTDFGKNSL